MVRPRAGKLGAGPVHCGGAARIVRRPPAGGARPCPSAAPYRRDGASRQAPPRGLQRTERHCKQAGDGMRIPWAWRSGLARRGPESLANPPLRTPGSGRPTYAWSDRGQGSSAQGQCIAEERHGTSAGRPSVELGHATEATPTTTTGHPGKSHPGGAKGPSGIANGREPGCASRHRRAGLGRTTAVAPTTPDGHPGKSHPRGSMGTSGIADGRVPRCASRGQGSWDPRSGDPNLGPPCAGMG
ncbi:hypothetical protein COCNU_scaffold087090G000010 [Cocos nucifera]|nr:hypothetical protein [Cocos nucifera]